MITTLTCILVPVFLFILFKGVEIYYAIRNEDRSLKAKITGLPKAAKPTKKEIAERNEIDRLLELDEYPTIVRQIKLDQHEQAIS